MAKNIGGFLENLFEYYFLNIIVNVNLFNDLKFKYYCKNYLEILLQEYSLESETKIDGRSHEMFSEKLLVHEISRSMVSRLRFFFFFEKFVKPSDPPPPRHPSSYILNVLLHT